MSSNTDENVLIQQIQEKIATNDETTAESTIEIVNTIGGINKILNDYLTNEQLISSINSDRLQQIHQILSKPKHIPINIQQSENNTESIWKSPLLTFKEKETFLHSFCSDNIADKLQSFAFNKIVIGVLSVYMVFSLFLLGNLYYLCSWIIIVPLIIIPWSVILVLLGNRMAMKHNATSFEFWLKMYYLFIINISQVVHTILKSQGTQTELLTVIAVSIAVPFVICTVSFIFNLDAYRINKLIKLFIPTALGLYYLIWWIRLTFTMYSNAKKEDPSLIKIANGIYISLNSQAQQGNFIIAIFCLKQAFMTWYRNRENNENIKSTTIKLTPRLKWETLPKPIATTVKHIGNAITETFNETEIAIAETVIGGNELQNEKEIKVSQINHSLCIESIDLNKRNSFSSTDSESDTN